MSENSRDFEFNFMPKTDDTFIAPNDKFNSFTNFCNNFGINNANEDNKSGDTVPEEDKNQKEKSCREETSKRKIGLSMPSKDKFIDFTVNQYRSDAIVCTLDENQRQIYYCYYCHQYVNDFDLIQTHIDSSNHMRSVLNGISFERGLDKHFVIESISEKKPKDLDKLISKVLERMPTHIKHYYFRNNIRLMDVMPPNAYFCKSCNQSIPKLKAIETHLLSETHNSSQQKPTLMQMINSSEDLTLKIGLEFLTEEKIADSSNVVYECELCKCLDCNYQKMFSHIKSLEHKINLLKKYKYETNELTSEDIEKLIQEISAKHSSGLMKTSHNNKRQKTSSELTPKSSSGSNSPSNDRLETHLTQTVAIDSPEAPKPELESNKSTDFLREDIFLPDFEEQKIIRTFESDGREIYYCCYCDQYYNTFQSLERHIEEQTHQRRKTNENNCAEGLNVKFSMKGLSDQGPGSSAPDDLSLVKRLNDIPVLIKHYYYKRGIKHTGAHVYYCRLCQTNIKSFDLIEEHFKTESHLKIEYKATKFNDLLFQTNQPIIGLKCIKEYINEKSKHVLYECTLCDYSNDYCQMFVHLNCYTHQIKVLKKIAPNSRVFKLVKENEVSLKSSELLKEKITQIEHQIGCGFVNRIFDSKPEPQKSAQTQSEQKVKEQTSDDIKGQSSAQLSAQSSAQSLTIIKQSSNEIQRPIEIMKNGFETKEEKVIPISDDKDLLSLRTLFAVRLENESEASVLVSIIESLKDELIDYYMNSVEPQKSPILVSQKSVEIYPIDEN